MSLVQPTVPERRPSPGLSLNLSSNNPFRNRAASPALPSPALSTTSLSTPRTTSARPQSRNPFLSAQEDEALRQQQPPQLSPSFNNNMASSSSATYGTAADELFKEMRLDDKKGSDAPADRRPAPQRSGTAPYRPRPDDDERRRRGPPRPRGQKEELDIFASPPRSRENRRPRRNSESSVMDAKSVEDERRRRERRRRDGDGKSRSTKVRKPQGLDLIDKLDVSGIYGPSMFHHDGPFDACNPHRNRKKDHRAPMEAFPADSANNAMGGAGPVNKHINLDQFHGREAEGFAEWSSTNKQAEDPLMRPNGGTGSAFYNPAKPIDYIHGDESTGLGTSTFLEGAPASKKDVERSEAEESAAFQGGLSRKKSLAQRIRGISRPPREGFGSQGRIQSPEAQYEWRRMANGQTPTDELPPRPGQAQSAGGPSRMHEKNPFFDDYDDAYEKKGATIKIAEQQRPSGRARAPSSPGAGLQRSVTADSFGQPRVPPPEPDRDTKPAGFLTRMKSLKGGKRARPERRPS